MDKAVEFSSFYTLLEAVKNGEEGKSQELENILVEYKSATNAESPLDELGKIFCSVGISELYKYAESTDLALISKIEMGMWKELANSNGDPLHIYLSKAMINYAQDELVAEKMSTKWNIRERMIKKHFVKMSRYITEGILQVID